MGTHDDLPQYIVVEAITAYLRFRNCQHGGSGFVAAAFTTPTAQPMKCSGIRFRRGRAQATSHLLCPDPARALQTGLTASIQRLPHSGISLGVRDCSPK